MKNLTLLLIAFCISLSWGQIQELGLTSSKIFWTAYKYTNKVGVSGTFDDVSVNSSKGVYPEDILKKLTFSISTKSINSSNTLRDGRIYNAFFKSMKDGEAIVGEIYNVRYNQAVAKITLNNITKHIPVMYHPKSDNIMELSLTLNLKDFKGENAIASLNRECKGGHTGEDGISLLWPTVEVRVSLNLE